MTEIPMTRLFTAAAILVVLTASGCSKETTALEIQPGHDVTLQKKDGVTVVGRLVEVKPAHITVEQRNGTKTSIPRQDVASLSYAPLPATSNPGAATDARPIGSTGAAATAEKPTPLTRVVDPGP